MQTEKIMIRGIVAELGLTTMFDNEVEKLRKELAGRKAVSPSVYTAYLMALVYAASEAQESSE